MVAAAVLLCLACHGPSDPGSSGTSPGAGSNGRVLRDGLQREVRLPVTAGRVVSLAPSITDSLLALGLGARLVGVSDFCRLPPGFPPVTRIGGLVNPNLEVIRALRPDLLLGTTSGNGPELVEQADALGVPLFIVHTPTIDSMMESLVALADVLGERARGASLAAALEERLRQVQERVTGLPRPRVLFVVWGDPLVVPGAASFLTDAIARAGGLSVTADAPAAHPTFSLEAAIARAPEVIFLTPDNADLAQRWKADPVWAGVPAIRSGRIHVVAEGVVQPGPAVVGGIEEMAHRLHPEAFQAPGPGADRAR
jgi:iron complex transport system substrate-binding protein